MLITNTPNPKVLFIGNPNLIAKNQMGNLAVQYNRRLPMGVRSNVAYWQLELAPSGKFLKKNYTEQIDEILEYTRDNEIQHLAITNAEMFKYITKLKLTDSIGKSFKGTDIFEGLSITPVLNHFMLLAKPQAITILEQSLKTLSEVIEGTYEDTDVNIVDTINTNVLYDYDDITKALDNIKDVKRVALDIETTGLLLGKDYIITMAFATSDTNSFSIPLCEEYSSEYISIRQYLKEWLYNFKGEQLWYNGMFDIPFLIRDLFEFTPKDSKKYNEILNSWNITDVILLNYLDNNSIDRLELGLKKVLKDVYGEYDGDIDQSQLLNYSYEQVGKYNCLDTTGTFYAYNKFYNNVVNYKQIDIFNDYYKPSLITLIKMKLNGFILDFDKLQLADEELGNLIIHDKEVLSNNKYIQEVEEDLNYNALFKYNNSHIKQKTLDDFNETFNAGSTPAKQLLLITNMGYPVLETTKTGNPSLGKEVIAKYLEKEKDETRKEVLETLLSLADASKVKNTFLKAFKNLSVKSDDYYRLHGNFKLFGTVSGRLSSSEPNLQNLPNNSKYGKLIKKLFVAPNGYILGGADFNALNFGGLVA